MRNSREGIITSGPAGLTLKIAGDIVATMVKLPGAEFPSVLRRVWKMSDPATREERQNDALARPTLHQRFSTVRGDYWVCAETGQLVRDQFPDRAEDLSGLYDQWWREHLAETPPTAEATEKKRKFLRRFEKYRQTTRMFEVGSGIGTLLRAAMDLGYQAEGNELSPFAAGKAEEFSGARVRVGPIETVELEEGVYDVVLLNNVFEHLENPRDVLVKLARALRPGGALYLQTLNGQSLSLFFNPYGWTYYIDGHLHIPSLVSLRHYFHVAGLTVVQLRTHGFSTYSVIRKEKGSKLRRQCDQWVAHIAGRLKLGHRARVFLEKR